MNRLTFLMVFCLLAATQAFANIKQGDWRWHNNDGDEASATWAGELNTGITITDYRAVRLRMGLKNTTGDPKSISRRIQYATSTEGPWYTITEATITAPFILGGNNTLISQGMTTTRQLPDDGSTFMAGTVITQQDDQMDNMPNATYLENEWCIKPTPQIASNTTYYFKVDGGDPPDNYPSVTTSGSAFSESEQALVPNGGFENSVNSWHLDVSPGITAVMTTTNLPGTFHMGANALNVNTNNGIGAGTVTLRSDPIELQDTGTYLLRFWALAEMRNAVLDLELNTNLGSDYCHYQIYDRFDDDQNGWQMYQYAFRVTEQTPLTILMHFKSDTYYSIDDIELVNTKTHPNIDVHTQYVWQNNFDESYGWISGDNNNPVLLPDSTVAWVYNDSYMGPIDPHSNVLSSSHIINNLVVHQSGDVLKSIYNGSAPNAQSLFSPGNGNLFWQSGGVIENGNLKVLLIEINDGQYTGTTWVGTLSLPDLRPIGLTKLPATIDVNPNCIMTDEDYHYIYFGRQEGTFEVYTFVARVPVGQLDSQTPWEYYQEDETWSTDYTNAKAIIRDVTAGNVLKLGENNYVMSGVPHLVNEIAAWFAPTPYGPWGHKTVVYQIPEQEGILAYQGHLNPLPRDGYYTFTYSVYPFVTEENGASGSVPMQLAVKSTYLPIYARAKLGDLSPFTARKSPDSLLEFTGKLQAGAVLLDWTAANATDDHYELQHSLDQENWSTLATVEGSDSLTLRTYHLQDATPFKGMNHYRLAIYNQDHQLSYSSVLSLDAATLAVSLVRFTAEKSGSHAVRLQWTTASEQDNAGFHVERSLDNKNFQELAFVKGAGNSTLSRQYSFTDETPGIGTNYYRLRYRQNNGLQTSATRSVLIEAPVRLIISPNPAKGRISFKLNGFSDDPFQVTLVDMAGRVIHQQVFSGADGPVFRLSKKPSSGIYLLKVKAQGLEQSSKVLVP